MNMNGYAARSTAPATKAFMKHHHNQHQHCRSVTLAMTGCLELPRQAMLFKEIQRPITPSITAMEKRQRQALERQRRLRNFAQGRGNAKSAGTGDMPIPGKPSARSIAPVRNFPAAAEERREERREEKREERREEKKEEKKADESDALC
eukprot:4056940-Amphidinium_carterae.1